MDCRHRLGRRRHRPPDAPLTPKRTASLRADRAGVEPCREATTTSTTVPRPASTERRPLLSIDEVAEWLGVNVRRLVDDRRVPFIKWGHLLRFDPADVEEWLTHHRVELRRPPRPRDLVTEDR